MGLQSALTTSLTGLQAAETVIDVAGNNIANTSTVGFKESDVLFATQFLQTQSIGSAPTDTSGGTNPRQIGLGVKVAAINPDFTQGTIQISSNPLDVAIQGDGFLIVRGSQGEQLYTRNGQLQINSENEVVNVTGNRVLGLPVDDDFVIDTTSELAPISIPLGSQTVAQATQNAFLQGNLSPEVEIGTTAGVLESQALGNVMVEYPTTDSMGGDFDNGDFQFVSPPDTSASSGVDAGGGTLADGAYEYRVVWFTNDADPLKTNESAPSVSISVNVTSGGTGQVDLSNLPIDPASPIWDGRRIYRSIDSGAFTQIGPDLDLATTTFSDDGSLAVGGALDASVLDQEEYSYYVAFYDSANQIQSRPTDLIGPFSVSDTTSRIRIDNLPQPTDPNFDQVRIYRNTGLNSTEFYLVDSLATGVTTFIDSKTDADLDGQPTIDLLGAKASSTTLLTDVVVLNGGVYTQPFVEGTLSFTGTKGGRALSAKEFTITATSNVNDLRNFMQQAFGVDTSLSDGAGSSLSTDGQLVFTSNRGIENELGASQTSFRITPTGGSTAPLAINFDITQEANGQGSTTNFVVYDSLGEPLTVRLTTVKESEDGNGSTFRWFATSEDNEPISGVSTFLDSGTLVFDRDGIVTTGETTMISIDHPFQSPLEFTLDFSSISGFAQTDSADNPVTNVNLTRQDGFPPGSLTSFTITESGLIRGVFSNGAERPLGQLRMARFANNPGLQQVGNNLFTTGINSGEPIIGDPGQGGLGALTAGAVELSNTDIGQNLIELILASTQYRGGARVITTTQQLLDELLNLRR